MIRDNLQITIKRYIVYFFCKLMYTTSALLTKGGTCTAIDNIYIHDIHTHEREHTKLQHLVRENCL